MRCVAIVGGAVVDIDPQPTDVTTCTLILVSPTEVIASPWLLEPDDAGLISVAIIGLWALAWAFRQFMGQIKES